MTLPTMRFLLPEQLGQPGTLEALIQAALAADFNIYHMSIEPAVVEQMKFKPTPADIEEELLLAYEKQKLNFRIMDNQRGGGLQIGIHLTWEPTPAKGLSRQVAVVEASTHSRSLFSDKKMDPVYYAQRMLTLGKRLYPILTPAFGWLDRSDRKGQTTEAEVQALTVSHLYWANFFSPAYVEQLGRERLLRVPVGTVEELGDGGLLYVLTPGLDTSRVLEKPRQAGMAHLGLLVGEVGSGCRR